MPQTNPFSYNAPRKLSDAEMARALRLDAMAEFDAINLYEAHMEATDNEDAKKVLAFVVKDEKEHFALFQELVRRLDPDQAGEMASASKKLDAILRAPLSAADEGTIEAAEEGEPSEGVTGGAGEEWATVGSLLGEPQS